VVIGFSYYVLEGVVKFLEMLDDYPDARLVAFLHGPASVFAGNPQVIVDSYNLHQCIIWLTSSLR
jgi:hypothetical protein